MSKNKDDDSVFLRFYPDEQCLDATSFGSPEEVAKWLKIGRRVATGK